MRRCIPTFARLAALLLVASIVEVWADPSVAAEMDARHETAPVVLQLHWYPQAQFAGYVMAEEKGFFRKAGVAVRLRWSVAGERPFQRLVDGQADFCIGWLSDAIRQRDAGQPLVNLAQVFQRSSALLVTWRRSGIKTPEDMNGRRVGLWGGDNDVQVLAFFHRRHVQPIVVPQSASIVPFLRGAVDVASAMHYNEYHKLIEAGVSPDQLHVFSLADDGLAFPEDGIYCTESTRGDRSAACLALATASRQGWDYALGHETETLDAIMRHCRAANVHTNRNHQRWMLRSVAAAIRGPEGGKPAPWGSLSADVYGGVARMLLDERMIRTIPPFEQLYQPVDR
ncbi:MAG: ABC transporter substrate-binding protein [Thermoguttaceae bacterium]